MYTCTPATSTRTNFASVSRMSPILQSELHMRIPSLLDASWFHAEFPDHLYGSLISSTSAPLCLAVCIWKFWASLLLPTLRCRNYTLYSSTSKALPETPGKNCSQNYVRHLLTPISTCQAPRAFDTDIKLKRNMCEEIVVVKCALCKIQMCRFKTIPLNLKVDSVQKADKHSRLLVSYNTQSLSDQPSNSEIFSLRLLETCPITFKQFHFVFKRSI